MKSTQAMRDRARELATPPRDDFDRAVLYILDDFDALSRRVPASGELEPVAWRGANYAAEAKRLIEDALTKGTNVLGGPEGETILAYSLPIGLWLMLQAAVRNLIDTLPPSTPPGAP